MRGFTILLAIFALAAPFVLAQDETTTAAAAAAPTTAAAAAATTTAKGTTAKGTTAKPTTKKKPTTAPYTTPAPIPVCNSTIIVLVDRTFFTTAVINRFIKPSLIKMMASYQEAFNDPSNEVKVGIIQYGTWAHVVAAPDAKFANPNNGEINKLVMNSTDFGDKADISVALDEVFKIVSGETKKNDLGSKRVFIWALTGTDATNQRKTSEAMKKIKKQVSAFALVSLFGRADDSSSEKKKNVAAFRIWKNLGIDALTVSPNNALPNNNFIRDALFEQSCPFTAAQFKEFKRQRDEERNHGRGRGRRSLRFLSIE